MYLLLGYGKSNRSIEKYFIKNNIKYLVYDDKINNIVLVYNNIKCIIKSNGINNNHFVLEEANKRNIKVISDLQLYYDLIKSNNYCLVTGSNGKTTTVSILEKCLNNTISIGNNGLPFFDYINDENNKILEVSSFMLEYINNINFKYNIITNIYPTHLEHHNTYINYIKAKTNFLKYLNKDNYIIYNQDDILLDRILSNYEVNKITVSLSNSSANIYLKDNYIYYLNNKILNINNIKLLGKHNIINIMLVLGVILNNKQYLKDNYKEEIYNYIGEKYRLQIIYDKEFKIINDSKSTNFNALDVALSSFDDDIILIVGGKKRKDNFSLLDKHLYKIKKVYCYGENKDDFCNYFINKNIECFKFDNLEMLVNSIVNTNLKNKNILFSPGSVSYDQYKDFEERGEIFDKLIKRKYHF